MATQKKPSGLGRGLDELLEDNAPTKRAGKPLVEPKGEVIVPKPVEPKGALSSIYEVKQRNLYETKPRTRSVKSNFKK